MENNYIFILAGGKGSRFWPLSTKDHPKQFLDIPGTGITLLQETFQRALKIVPHDKILLSPIFHMKKKFTANFQN